MSTSSLSEKISSKRFIKKQIFFDFVPPPLNYFEYTLNELNNIERSFNRIMKPDCLQPVVSKYMSFTFLYGNHMDVTQASLALFDAEPGEILYFIDFYVLVLLPCLYQRISACQHKMIIFNLPLQKKKKITTIKVE